MLEQADVLTGMPPAVRGLLHALPPADVAGESGEDSEEYDQYAAASYAAEYLNLQYQKTLETAELFCRLFAIYRGRQVSAGARWCRRDVVNDLETLLDRTRQMQTQLQALEVHLGGRVGEAQAMIAAVLAKARGEAQEEETGTPASLEAYAPVVIESGSKPGRPPTRKKPAAPRRREAPPVQAPVQAPVGDAKLPLPGFRCNRCGHEWLRRRLPDGTYRPDPKHCPNPKCKSRSWDKPPTEAGKTARGSRVKKASAQRLASGAEVVV